MPNLGPRRETAAGCQLVSVLATYLLNLFFVAIDEDYKTMTVKQLRAFLAVADSLSFAQACLRLHLSQPALSLAIKNLESHLGGPLLVRTTRSVALTPEGALLAPIARRLLADWDSAEELLRQHFTLQLGQVAIAAMPSFAANLLPPTLKVFRDHYPKINVTVHDVINEQVIEMVRDRRVQLGVVIEPENLEGLAFTPFFTDRFVAAVPAASALARHVALSWSELMDEPFIALQRPSTVRKLLESQRGPLRVAFESHQLATVGQMVAAGLGVSVVPSLCAPQMEALGVRCVALEAPHIERRVGLLQLAGQNLATAAQVLADTLCDQSRCADRHETQ